MTAIIVASVPPDANTPYARVPGEMTDATIAMTLDSKRAALGNAACESAFSWVNRATVAVHELLVPRGGVVDEAPPATVAPIDVSIAPGREEPLERRGLETVVGKPAEQGVVGHR